MIVSAPNSVPVIRFQIQIPDVQSGLGSALRWHHILETVGSEDRSFLSRSPCVAAKSFRRSLFESHSFPSIGLILYRILSRLRDSDLRSVGGVEVQDVVSVVVEQAGDGAAGAGSHGRAGIDGG